MGGEMGSKKPIHPNDDGMLILPTYIGKLMAVPPGRKRTTCGNNDDYD